MGLQLFELTVAAMHIHDGVLAQRMVTDTRKLFYAFQARFSTTYHPKSAL
jgi:hypothetical protein